jgi:hypothetical protein
MRVLALRLVSVGDHQLLSVVNDAGTKVWVSASTNKDYGFGKKSFLFF